MARDQAADRPAIDLLSPARPGGEHASPGSRDFASEVDDLGIAGLTDVHLVNRGEASSVYRARQLTPPRTVAVKVLHDELSSDTGQRFDRERMIVGELSGQSAIVPVFECGLTGGNEPYLVMPWYQRGSLTRLVTEHGRLGWREAAFLIEPVAVTLAEVHSRGLVHRNVKPENILLTDFLLPRLADFGMCLPAGQRSTPATTAPSLFYGAPELAVPGEADPRADVYGLGAVLCAMLSGQVTFTGYTAGVDARTATARARTRRLGHPAEPVPDPLRDLIASAMAADPAERPANAAAFVSALRRGAAAGPRTTRSTSDVTAEPGLVDTGTGQDPAERRPQPETSGPSTGTALPEPDELDLSDGPTSVAIAATAPAVGPAPNRGTDPGHPEPTSGTRSPNQLPTGAADVKMTGEAGPTAPNGATGSSPVTSSESIKADARYVLVLVACISLVILAMVAAAMMPEI